MEIGCLPRRIKKVDSIRTSTAENSKFSKSIICIVMVASLSSYTNDAGFVFDTIRDEISIANGHLKETTTAQ